MRARVAAWSGRPLAILSPYNLCSTSCHPHAQAVNPDLPALSQRYPWPAATPSAWIMFSPLPNPSPSLHVKLLFIRQGLFLMAPPPGKQHQVPHWEYLLCSQSHLLRVIGAALAMFWDCYLVHLPVQLCAPWGWRLRPLFPPPLAQSQCQAQSRPVNIYQIYE